MEVSTALKRATIRMLGTKPIGRIAAPFYRGRGVIFTLHRVLERPESTLIPGIAITQRFLEDLVRYTRKRGFEFLALEEAANSLLVGHRRSPFACLTFDDGYADILTNALPILEAYRIPFTVFLVSGFLNRTVVGSWNLLEEFILQVPRICLPHPGLENGFSSRSLEEKRAAFRMLNLLQWRDKRLTATIEEMAADRGIDPRKVLDARYLTEVQVRRLLSSGLCELGGHTYSHPPLSHLTREAARRELVDSRATLSATFGVEINLVAYPFGSSGQCGSREFSLASECGYRVGVTTRPGNVFAEHRDKLLALPRTGLSLFPHAHNLWFVEASLTGARNAFMNRLRRVRRE